MVSVLAFFIPHVAMGDIQLFGHMLSLAVGLLHSPHVLCRDEFGATGLSDLDTLRAVIPAAELASGWQTSATPSWNFHRLGEWYAAVSQYLQMTSPIACTCTYDQCGAPPWAANTDTEWLIVAWVEIRGNVGGYRPLFSTNGVAASTLQDEVRWSQFMQV